MNQTLQHAGYDGSVLFSAQDRMLHGRILGIRDTVSYGGITVRELEKNFRAAVDEYLRFCEAQGKKPDTPFKGSFNVRVTPDLHQRAAFFADEHEMKLNAVVQQALSEFLAHSE